MFASRPGVFIFPCFLKWSLTTRVWLVQAAKSAQGAHLSYPTIAEGGVGCAASFFLARAKDGGLLFNWR